MKGSRPPAGRGSASSRWGALPQSACPGVARRRKIHRTLPPSQRIRKELETSVPGRLVGFVTQEQRIILKKSEGFVDAVDLARESEADKD